MTETRREINLVLAIAVVAALGLGADALSDSVSPPEETVVSDRHVERGTFCPPPVSEILKAQNAVATASETGVPIDYQDAARAAEAEPATPKSSTVAPGAFLLHNSEETALTAIGFGDRPIAGALQSWSAPAEGAGAALCSERPSNTWYFPAGSSELRFDERLLLFNPYPDEAVARVTLFTPTVARNPTSLSDVAVPSGGWTEVEVNEFVNTQKLLSARVETQRGRLIAWRVLFQKPEGGPFGASFTLGAPEASDTWYFPHGLIGDGASETLTILNPTEEEATVTIQTFSADLAFRRPDDLNEIRLEPGTSREINLARAGPSFKGNAESAHFSATVTTCPLGAGREEICPASEQVPIVVERSLSVESGPFEGVSSEIGTPVLGDRLLLPPPAQNAGEDLLALFNGGTEPVDVQVKLLTLKGPETPTPLTNLRVEPGRRVERSLDDFAELGPFFAVVTSSGPLTAERIARSVSGGDLVDVMGRSVAPADSGSEP